MGYVAHKIPVVPTLIDKAMSTKGLDKLIDERGHHRTLVRHVAQKRQPAHHVVRAWAQLSFVMVVQELCAELKAPMPVYTATSSGPEDDQSFTAVATVAGLTVGNGVGHNKKLAEKRSLAQRLARFLRGLLLGQLLVVAHTISYGQGTANREL